MATSQSPRDFVYICQIKDDQNKLENPIVLQGNDNVLSAKLTPVKRNVFKIYSKTELPPVLIDPQEVKNAVRNSEKTLYWLEGTFTETGTSITELVKKFNADHQTGPSLTVEPLMRIHTGFSWSAEHTGNGPTLSEPPRKEKPLGGFEADRISQLKRIGLLDSEGNRQTTFTGAGVTIAVLDNSPTNFEEVLYPGSPVDYYADLTSDYLQGQAAFLPNEERNIDAPKVGLNNRPLEALEIDGTVLDSHATEKYHGIMVASLIKQVAPKAEVLLLRVLDDSGEGPNTLVIEGLNTLTYLYKNRNTLLIGGEKIIQDKFVVNLSLGAYESMHPGVDFPDYLASCKELTDVEAVIVAASGNFSTTKVRNLAQEPAADAESSDTSLYWNLINVAATGQKPTEYAWFSNIGIIGAPGIDIVMDVKMLSAEKEEINKIKWSGTSFSTPLVAGAAALLLGEGVPARDVKRKLWENATQPTDWNCIRELDLSKVLDSSQQSDSPVAIQAV